MCFLVYTCVYTHAPVSGYSKGLHTPSSNQSCFLHSWKNMLLIDTQYPSCYVHGWCWVTTQNKAFPKPCFSSQPGFLLCIFALKHTEMLIYVRDWDLWDNGSVLCTDGREVTGAWCTLRPCVQVGWRQFDLASARSLVLLIRSGRAGSPLRASISAALGHTGFGHSWPGRSVWLREWSGPRFQ